MPARLKRLSEGIFIVPGIKKAAVRVDRANWKLFTGLPSLLPTLNGDGLPAVPFKCAVTLSAVTGHADVNGSITIGSETLAFTSATRRTTSNLLTALPVVSVNGLDCNILIEAMSSGGANIQKETLTNILIGNSMQERMMPDSMGNFTITEYITKTQDTGCNVAGIIRVDGVDYTIFKMKPIKPGSREKFRRITMRQ